MQCVNWNEYTIRDNLKLFPSKETTIIISPHIEYTAAWKVWKVVYIYKYNSQCKQKPQLSLSREKEVSIVISISDMHYWKLFDFTQFLFPRTAREEADALYTLRYPFSSPPLSRANITSSSSSSLQSAELDYNIIAGSIYTRFLYMHIYTFSRELPSFPSLYTRAVGLSRFPPFVWCVTPRQGTIYIIYRTTFCIYCR